MAKYIQYPLNKIIEKKIFLRWDFSTSRKLCREGLASSELISKKKVFSFKKHMKINQKSKKWPLMRSIKTSSILNLFFSRGAEISFRL